MLEFTDATKQSARWLARRLFLRQAIIGIGVGAALFVSATAPLESVEGAIYWLLGTTVGVGVSLLVLRWFVDTVANSTMPDFGMDLTLAPGTIAATLVIGVGSVAVAPMFTIRRLRRMSIPATLRIVE